jgi:hypothetical protein
MTITSGTPISDFRPRLVCRVVRLWCAVSQADQPRHVATCASCQVYFAAANELESQLRRAAHARSTASDATQNLEQQILRAVRSSASRPRRASAWQPTRSWLMGGVCAAAAAFAIGLALRFGTGSAPRERMADATPTDDAAMILSTVESLSSELVGTVIPSAGELVVQNPLQEEIGSVYSDMRSALDFLALNFLPATRLNPPAEPVRPGRS